MPRWNNSSVRWRLTTPTNASAIEWKSTTMRCWTSASTRASNNVPFRRRKQIKKLFGHPQKPGDNADKEWSRWKTKEKTKQKTKQSQGISKKRSSEKSEDDDSYNSTDRQWSKSKHCSSEEESTPRSILKKKGVRWDGDNDGKSSRGRGRGTKGGRGDANKGNKGRGRGQR